MSEQTFVNDDVFKYLPTLAEDTFDLCVADPPYAISNSRVFTRKGAKDIRQDFGFWDHVDFDVFTAGWLAGARRVTRGDLYAFCPLEKIGLFAELAGEAYAGAAVWHKTNPAPSFMKRAWVSSCEAIVRIRQGGTFNWLGQNEMHNHFLETPICMGKERKEGGHPTQKRLDVCEWIMRIGSNPGDLVLDLFAGSGTTSAVCQKLGRRFVAIERDPIYFQNLTARLRAGTSWTTAAS